MYFIAFSAFYRYILIRHENNSFKPYPGGCMNKKVIIGFAAISLLALTSCNRNPISSDEDDNTTTTVSADEAGTIAFATMSESSEINEVLSTENPAPADLYSQAALPDVASDISQTLNKTTAGTTISLDTLENDVIQIAITTEGDAAIRYDTIEAVLNETVFDAIEGNESLIAVYGAVEYNSGMHSSYLITDTDGDGIINSSTGEQHASLTIYSITDNNNASAVETYTAFEVGSGADNDFDAESDNVLYSATWTQLKAGDTIAYARFTNASDGIVAATGEGTVDISFYRTVFPFRPFLEYRKVYCTIQQNADGKKETLSFSAEEHYSTGRTNRLVIKDDDGSTTITPNSTAHAYFTTNNPAVSDSEITAQIHLVFDPGNNLCDETDNYLQEATFEKSYRLGALDSLNLHYTFSPAVAFGSEPESGSFELEARYRNGKDATLTGTFDNGTIEATFTGPEGKTTEVKIEK